MLSVTLNTGPETPVKPHTGHRTLVSTMSIRVFPRRAANRTFDATLVLLAGGQAAQHTVSPKALLSCEHNVILLIRSPAKLIDTSC